MMTGTPAVVRPPTTPLASNKPTFDPVLSCFTFDKDSATSGASTYAVGVFLQFSGSQPGVDSFSDSGPPRLKHHDVPHPGENLRIRPVDVRHSRRVPVYSGGVVSCA